MKVLHVIPSISISYGGPVTTLSNMIGIWKSCGVEAHVLTIANAGTQFPIGTNVTTVPSSFPARLSNSSRALNWLIANFDPYDVVVFHSIWSIINLRLSWALRRRQRSYWVIPHGSLDPFDLQKKALAKRLLGPLMIRPYLQGSSMIVCSTQREAECLVTYGAKSRVEVLPWAVLPERAGISKSEARAALGLNEDEFAILFLGRIDYKKGFPVLMPAFKKLLALGIRAKLFVVGPDSHGYLQQVERMSEQLEITRYVTFMPTKVGKEKLLLLAAADCFVLPSLNENFGNTVVEALQQGLPVVISNNVYICDHVARAKAGFVCGYDSSEVATALSTLARDPALRLQMADAASRLGLEFSPDVLRDRYIALLDRVPIPTGAVR